MLSKEVFIEQMNKLMFFYPNWNPKLEQKEVAAAWYEQFEDMTDECFIKTIKEYVKKEKFHPTVAGLREYKVIPDYYNVNGR